MADDEDQLDELIESYEAQARNHDAAVDYLLDLNLLEGMHDSIRRDIEGSRRLAKTCRFLAQEVRDSRA